MEPTGAASPTGQSSVEILWCGKDDVLDVWPQLQAGIRQALTRSCGDRMTEAGLLAGIRRGMFELHLIMVEGLVTGAMVLQFVERPAGEACEVLALIGKDYRRWAGELKQALLERTQGRCYCVEAYCRDGVAKVLADHGWSRKATLMEVRPDVWRSETSS